MYKTKEYFNIDGSFLKDILCDCVYRYYLNYKEE